MTGGVSACGVPGPTVGTPEPCPTYHTRRREHRWERGPPGREAGRHPHDGRRLRVRCTRHNRGHAGAVPYIPHATTRASLGARPSGARAGERANLGARPAGARPAGARGGEASSRRAASPRAVYPARRWARRSRALQRGAGRGRVNLGARPAGARAGERVNLGARPSGARAGRHPHDGRRLRVRCTRPDRGHAGAVPYSEARGGARPSGARGVGNLGARPAGARAGDLPHSAAPTDLDDFYRETLANVRLSARNRASNDE